MRRVCRTSTEIAADARFHAPEEVGPRDRPPPPSSGWIPTGTEGAGASAEQVARGPQISRSLTPAAMCVDMLHRIDLVASPFDRLIDCPRCRRDDKSAQTHVTEPSSCRRIGGSMESTRRGWLPGCLSLCMRWNVSQGGREGRALPKYPRAGQSPLMSTPRKHMRSVPPSADPRCSPEAGIVVASLANTRGPEAPAVHCSAARRRRTWRKTQNKLLSRTGRKLASAAGSSGSVLCGSGSALIVRA